MSERPCASTRRRTTALGTPGLLAAFFAGAELWRAPRFCELLVLTGSAAALAVAARWRAVAGTARASRASAPARGATTELAT